MPLYEYRCNSCGEEFDLVRSYDKRKEPEADPCPECGEVAVTYKVSAPKIGYFHKGSMRTTDSFNDRLKEIKKTIPKRYQDNINNVIK